MQSTWTTSSGKTISLETTVAGSTGKDNIHTEYNLSIDGKAVKVTRRTVVKGQNCLEFVIPRTTKKNLLPISAEIVASINAELDTVKNAVEPVDVSLSQYDKNYEMMSRLMNGENSDY